MVLLVLIILRVLGKWHLQLKAQSRERITRWLLRLKRGGQANGLPRVKWANLVLVGEKRLVLLKRLTEGLMNQSWAPIITHGLISGTHQPGLKLQQERHL